MRDRLIEIVKDSLMKHIGKSCNLAENITDDLMKEITFRFPAHFENKREKRMVELLNSIYAETKAGTFIYFTEDESELLADYILADGWIRPPCKVGDTVRTKYGYTFKIERIEILKDKMVFRCGNDGTDDYMAFLGDEIGTEVFLTKEEAEKALKERNGD